MGKSRVTIRDIAREAGVSHATVSRALNNHREINIETRKRIHELARQMNYIPDGIARGLVTNRSNCVGMIIPDMDNQFVDRVVDGAEDYLNGNGRCMILAQSRYQEGKELNLVKTMLEQRVEGLIVSPLSVDNLTKIKELCQDIPLVFVCADTSEYGERCVASDDYSIGRCVAEYLLSLGHREILYLGGDEKNQGICRRVQGFRKVLEEQGYTDIEERVIMCPLPRESGYEQTQRLIRRGKLPTAIAAANDMMAIGVMEALYHDGYRVPEDVSVIGCDDIDFAGFPQISLTTIAQPGYEIGRRAAKMLFQEKERGQNRIILEPSLKIRKSCQAYNGG